MRSLLRLRGMLRLRLVMAAMGLCVALAICLWWARAMGASPQRGGVAGNWVAASPMQTQNELSIQGVLLPVQSVDVVAPTEGRLVSVDVAWGDRVMQGQLLARVDSPELSAQLREAEASLLRSRIEADAQTDPQQSAEYRSSVRRERTAAKDLEAARGRESDTRSLFDKGYVARVEFDQAKREVETAQQQHEEAREELAAVKRKWDPDQLRARRLDMLNREAKLQELRARQLAMSLRAPMSGVVMYPVRSDTRDSHQPTEFKAGSQVSSRDALMTIGNTSSYLVRGVASEFDVRWLRPGLPATVQLATMPGQRIAARLIRVAAQGRSNGTLAGSAPEFEIQVQVPAPRTTLSAEQMAALRVGSSAKVELKDPGADAMLVLPLPAVRWADDGAAQVRVKNRSGEESWRRIAIAKADASQVFVRDGLQADDRVWVPTGHGMPAENRPGFLRSLFGSEDER